MATGSVLFADSGLADLDKILQSLEIENKQQQNEIQKEQQQAAAFEAAITETEKKTKTLQEDTARLDAETTAAHQQFRCNKETHESLKNHYLALVLNQETAQRELHELQDRWQVQRAEHERVLQHYESIWEQYKAKYEERELAVELRQWQQQVNQIRERLEEAQHRVTTLKAAVQKEQDKKRNALKPFKSLNNWIIQIAEVWAKTRDLRKQKEEAQHSINDAKKKLQDKKDRQLQQQKEQELERQRKLKEAEERKRQEELERQKQQQLHQQQQQLQQLKAQQHQQQQLRQQQQQFRQIHLTAAASPHQVPLSPLQQPPRRLQSQYFQSPLIGSAAPRSNNAPATPQQQLRQPPYLQLPILASPRQTVGGGASSSSVKTASQQLVPRIPGDSPQENQQKQPRSVVQQSTESAPASHEMQARPQVSTQENVIASQEQTDQTAIPTQDKPAEETRDAPEMQVETDQQGDDGRGEESGMATEATPDACATEVSQTPSLEPTSIQDPGTPGSVASLPPQSPFDLEAHLQTLNEMAKSPGFTFSCRPMFGQKETNGDTADKSQTDAQPTSSSSDNFESPFLQMFTSGMDVDSRVSQPSSQPPAQIFGSSRNAKESSQPMGLFGRPNSPMDTGQSRTQGGVLALFGGGQDKTKRRDDEEGSPAVGFSFDFTGGPASPDMNSSSEGKFSLF